MRGASAVDDRWIDSVAREMTEAPPPADLRARVLSQIAKDERTNKPLPRRLAPAAIALAAAAVLVATLWPQWRGEVPVQNQSATAAPPSTGAGVSREPEPAPVAQGADVTGSGAADGTRRAQCLRPSSTGPTRASWRRRRLRLTPSRMIRWKHRRHRRSDRSKSRLSVSRGSRSSLSPIKETFNDEMHRRVRAVHIPGRFEHLRTGTGASPTARSTRATASGAAGARSACASRSTGRSRCSGRSPGSGATARAAREREGRRHGDRSAQRASSCAENASP